MKFLCDHMLHKLCKWLRAAGYDTCVASKDEDDKSIYAQAKLESRKLITRDKHFLEFDPKNEIVVYLRSNELDDCIEEVSSKLSINWLKAPFSRCLICNAELLLEKDNLSDAPKDILKEKKQFWRCPNCSKLFWEGSHTEQMFNTLIHYQSFSSTE